MIIADATVRTASEFEAWLMNAKFGEWCLYYTGHIGERAAFHKPTEKLRNTVFLHASEGFVALVQQRVAPGSCSYFAKRVRPEYKDAVAPALFPAQR